MSKFHIANIRVDDNRVVGSDSGCGCCEVSQRLTKAQLQEFIDDLKVQLVEAESLLERNELFDGCVV